MKVEWSHTAKRNYFRTADYIKEEWGRKSLNTFRKSVKESIAIIAGNPEAFPISKQLEYRKFVVSELNSIIYTVHNDMIYIVDFVNTRMGHPY